MFSLVDFLFDFKYWLFSFPLDSLIVAVKPKPPVRHILDGLDEEDDEEDLVRTEQIVAFSRTSFSFD